MFTISSRCIVVCLVDYHFNPDITEMMNLVRISLDSYLSTFNLNQIPASFVRVTPFTCELVTTTWPRSSAAPALRPFEWPRPTSTTTTTHRRWTTTSPSSSCTGRRSWNREYVSSVCQPEGRAKLPEKDALSQDMATWEKVRIQKCHNSVWMFISVRQDFLSAHFGCFSNLLKSISSCLVRY